MGLGRGVGGDAGGLGWLDQDRQRGREAGERGTGKAEDRATRRSPGEMDVQGGAIPRDRESERDRECETQVRTQRIWGH